jgi:hypothetical protein
MYFQLHYFTRDVEQLFDESLSSHGRPTDAWAAPRRFQNTSARPSDRLRFAAQRLGGAQLSTILMRLRNNLQQAGKFEARSEAPQT